MSLRMLDYVYVVFLFFFLSSLRVLSFAPPALISTQAAPPFFALNMPVHLHSIS